MNYSIEGDLLIFGSHELFQAVKIMSVNKANWNCSDPRYNLKICSNNFDIFKFVPYLKIKPVCADC